MKKEDLRWRWRWRFDKKYQLWFTILFILWQIFSYCSFIWGFQFYLPHVDKTFDLGLSGKGHVWTYTVKLYNDGLQFIINSPFPFFDGMPIKYTLIMNSFYWIITVPIFKGTLLRNHYFISTCLQYVLWCGVLIFKPFFTLVKSFAKKEGNFIDLLKDIIASLLIISLNSLKPSIIKCLAFRHAYTTNAGENLNELLTSLDYICTSAQLITITSLIILLYNILLFPPFKIHNKAIAGVNFKFFVPDIITSIFIVYQFILWLLGRYYDFMFLNLYVLRIPSLKECPNVLEKEYF